MFPRHVNMIGGGGIPDLTCLAIGGDFKSSQRGVSGVKCEETMASAPVRFRCAESLAKSLPHLLPFGAAYCRLCRVLGALLNL